MIKRPACQWCTHLNGCHSTCKMDDNVVRKWGHSLEAAGKWITVYLYSTEQTEQYKWGKKQPFQEGSTYQVPGSTYLYTVHVQYSAYQLKSYITMKVYKFSTYMYIVQHIHVVKKTLATLAQHSMPIQYCNPILYHLCTCNWTPCLKSRCSTVSTINAIQ